MIKGDGLIEPRIANCIRAYTSGSAYGEFMEGKNRRVLLTIVGGRTVYAAAERADSAKSFRKNFNSRRRKFLLTATFSGE
jgi:hypothetical protein